MLVINSSHASNSPAVVALLWCLMSLFSCGGYAAVGEGMGDVSEELHHHAMSKGMEMATHDSMSCCEQLQTDCCQSLPGLTAKIHFDLELPVFEFPLFAIFEQHQLAYLKQPLPPDHQRQLIASYPRLHLLNSVLLD
jgi:hypothetical protein